MQKRSKEGQGNIKRLVINQTCQRKLDLISVVIQSCIGNYSTTMSINNSVYIYIYIHCMERDVITNVHWQLKNRCQLVVPLSYYD